MISEKKGMIGMFLLIGILFSLSGIGADFSISNPQLSAPGTSFSFLGNQGINPFPIFNSNSCQTGQDFIVQVAPFGCTPAVVRSDLLEEQNVPVFCQLYATKINPLINVNAVSSLSFSGNYPQGISGVGFQPANAALRTSGTTTLNSPILQNIGYAVIVLNQNQNESSMPNFISGNLTAAIHYDVQNAFGVGQSTQYLPILTQDLWNQKFAQYGFWNGKGFLRADGVGSDLAAISLYSDQNNKVSSFTLKTGQTSGQVYLPGFYCQAGLQLRLDSVQNPDTRAALDINGQTTEVVDGEQFLDNHCRVNNIDNKGLKKSVDVSCSTDNGPSRLSLQINPKIKLNINGVQKDVHLGDQVYTTKDQRTVYLAYVGTKEDSSNPDDLFVYFLETPLHQDNLAQDDLNSVNFIVKNLIFSRVTGGQLVDLGANAIKSYIGLANRQYQSFINDKKIYRVNFKENGKAVSAQDVFGEQVAVLGFSDAKNSEIKDSNARIYYQNAMADYRQIINSFPNEKETPADQKTFGVSALESAITLASNANQKSTVLTLCSEFKTKYPDSSDLATYCGGTYSLSSEESSAWSVLINGKLSLISLKEISEPKLDDYSAEIQVRKPDGSLQSYLLGKNEIVPLSDSPQYAFRFTAPNEIGAFGDNTDTFSTLYYVYFGFAGGKWQWSVDKKTWTDLGDTRIAKNNIVPQLGGTTLQNKETINLFSQLSGKSYDDGSAILLATGATKEISTVQGDFLQLVDLSQSAAKVRVPISEKTALISDTLNLAKNAGQSSAGYVFTLTKINLNPVAKVTILPNIQNSQTQANFSFNIGIEKRNIQLSPDEIKKRIDSLNNTINQWQSNSDKLGNVVKGFNAACLTVGTAISIKNLFGDFDGRAIARQEVMSSSGGWVDICKDKVSKKEFDSLNQCLLKNSDRIDKDVSAVEKIISSQNGITNENAAQEFEKIRTSFPSKIVNPDKTSESIDLSSNSDVYTAFSQKGLDAGKVSLTQARDIERLQAEISSADSSQPELKLLAQRRLWQIFSGMQENSKNYATFTSLQGDVSNLGLGVNYYGGQNSVSGNYNGGVLLGKQFKFSDGTDPKTVFNPTTSYPTQIILYNNQQYVLTLNGQGNKYAIDQVYKYGGIDSSNNLIVNSATPEETSTIKNRFSSFDKFDATAYTNVFKDPQVKYFETDPYKGLPAVVPFDLANGWYVATKQTLSGLGNIRAYDASGKITSFYICNVGPNGREEFTSGFGDDICRNFNPGVGQVQGDFPGLNPSQTSSLISKANQAVSDASNQYSSATSTKKARILGQVMDVGLPASGNPDIQCQDFMSPKDCLLLFNACDPVVCPVSRCNFGGTYYVPDVVQSGIIGSTLLCLPNAKEGVAVPICLTGVKAGVDSLISVEKSYRDCLQTNLNTGKTIGICDEIHSVYLCDFFWSQAQPMANIIVPKIFEVLTGQTGRGGGEYLGVASAWANAGKSLDYMTQYYGAASFAAFKTGVIKEVGNAICRNFISASYPSNMNFFDSLIQPASPPQYTAWFSESTFTTATVPPTSQYKVYYHIFAGQNTGQGNTNAGAFYSVYLKTPSANSFYQYAPTISVASGFISPGNAADDTKDFTAPSGYTQLCISVNGQEQCGFKKVSTDFGLNYLNDLYLQEQANQTNINSESACVSGTPSIYSFINPNLQAGAQDFVDPALYTQQITRVCSTDNPGKGTDPNAGAQGSRWVQVGTCDSTGKLKCFLDTNSVKNAIKSTTVANQTIQSVSNNFVQQLMQEGNFINDFGKEITKINSFDDGGKVGYITSDLIARAFLSGQKAKLFLIRGDAFAGLFQKSLAGIVASATGVSATGVQNSVPSGPVNGGQTGTAENQRIILLDTEILNLNDIINKYGNVRYAVCPTDFTTCGGDANQIAFKTFIDRINSEGFLTVDEYNLLIDGDPYRGRIYGALDLRDFLTNERKNLMGLQVQADACVKSAHWAQRAGSAFKDIDSQTVTPGTVYFQLDLKINSCAGYYLVAYNPDIFGSEEQKLLISDAPKLGDLHYLNFDVDVTHSSGLLGTGLFSTATPRNYKFKIYTPGNSLVYEGQKITVSTTTTSKI